MTKPLLKWVGGKTQILDEIIPRIPRYVEEYHEPFLGGGSVLLALLSSPDHTIERVYAYDVNPRLISFYNHVKTCPQDLYQDIRALFDSYNAIETMNGPRTPVCEEEAVASKESFYYWCRFRFNEQTQHNSVQSSALFLFINKTCFRGLYREGPHGFNVPFGNYKRVDGVDETHLAHVSTLLVKHNVRLFCRDFRTIAIERTNNVFVYLDPPYIPVNTDSFVTYTASGFDEECHTALINLCIRIHEHGGGFLMSNSNVPRLHDTFGDTTEYTVHAIPCRRRIHSRTPNATAIEVLIHN